MTRQPRLSFRSVTKTFRTRNRSDSLRDAIPRMLGRLVGRRPSAPARFTALRDLSFDVGEQEVLGIVGSNGAGKSTILRLAAGVYPPTAGAVEVRGRISALIELSAGFHPDLSGRENVYLVGALLGLARREVDEAFDRIVEFADIGAYLESPVRTYSSGMAVRLGFAVAAHVPAEILLVDEVLAVGDLDFRSKCLRRMAQRREEGVTVLFVSHNMAVVEQFCDRVIFLKDGGVAADGDPRDSIEVYRAAVAEKRRRQLAESRSRLAAAGGEAGFRLDGIELVGDEGLPAGTMRSGGSLTVRGRWASDERCARPTIVIDVSTPRGIVCASTASTGAPAPEEWEGEGTFELVFPRLEIVPGAYDVNLHVVDATGLVTLDRHSGVHPLSVTGATEFGNPGLLNVPTRWKLA